MTGGVITGGWNFVWAAYSLTAAVLAIYMISVLSRYAKERSDAARRKTRSAEVN
jgi:heme exporter protein D